MSLMDLREALDKDLDQAKALVDQMILRGTQAQGPIVADYLHSGHLEAQAQALDQIVGDLIGQAYQVGDLIAWTIPDLGLVAVDLWGDLRYRALDKDLDLDQALGDLWDLLEDPDLNIDQVLGDLIGPDVDPLAHMGGTL